MKRLIFQYILLSIFALYACGKNAHYTGDGENSHSSTEEGRLPLRGSLTLPSSVMPNTSVPIRGSCEPNGNQNVKITSLDFTPNHLVCDCVSGEVVQCEDSQNNSIDNFFATGTGPNGLEPIAIIHVTNPEDGSSMAKPSSTNICTSSGLVSFPGPSTLTQQAKASGVITSTDGKFSANYELTINALQGYKHVRFLGFTQGLFMRFQLKNTSHPDSFDITFSLTNITQGANYRIVKKQWDSGIPIATGGNMDGSTHIYSWAGTEKAILKDPPAIDSSQYRYGTQAGFDLAHGAFEGTEPIQKLTSGESLYGFSTINNKTKYSISFPPNTPSFSYENITNTGDGTGVANGIGGKRRSTHPNIINPSSIISGSVGESFSEFTTVQVEFFNCQ